jgi:GNAT superfamily N-acetyltransferase
MMEIIDLRDEQGGAFGYVVDSSQEQVGHYLDECLAQHAAAVVRWLRRHYQRVAILKSLEVDDAAQGQGLGTALLTQFMAQAHTHGAPAVLLIADRLALQRDGFVLQAWYERHGFRVVAATGCGPVMVHPGTAAAGTSGIGTARRQDMLFC